MAINELLQREKGEPIGSLFFVSLLIVSLQLRHGFYLTPAIAENPELLLFYGSSLYCFGPVMLIMTRRLFGLAKSEARAPLWIHFTPAVTMLALQITIFLTVDMNELSQQIQRGMQEFSFDRINLVMLGVVPHFFLYGFHFHFQLRRVRIELATDYRRALLMLSSFVFLIVICFGASLFMKSTVLLTITFSLITMLVILLFFLNNRFPRFFDDIRKEIQQIRYQKTAMTGINIQAAKDRLHQLLDEDKVFMDDDLDLQMLAGQLQVSRHQLSRIINEQFGCNFYALISKFRVEECKRLIAKYPGRSLLSIAYEAGFNTQRTFNSQFARHTGIQPSEFRKGIAKTRDKE